MLFSQRAAVLHPAVGGQTGRRPVILPEILTEQRKIIALLKHLIVSGVCHNDHIHIRKAHHILPEHPIK